MAGMGAVNGYQQTNHAGQQGASVRVDSDRDGFVSVGIDWPDRGPVVLDYHAARLLADMLVALSRPEGTE